MAVRYGEQLLQISRFIVLDFLNLEYPKNRSPGTQKSTAGVPAVLKFLNFLKLQSCPEIVLKFEVVLKSQSFSTNVLILTIVVHAQLQFNVLLAALLICLLHMWIQFLLLFLFETVTIMVSCVALPW